MGIEIIAYSDQMIHAMASFPGVPYFLLTSVYGSPDADDRKGLWDSLSAASSLHSLPWLALVDFNQVLSAEEKMGRHGVNLNNCQLMLNCLRQCNLIDL